MSKHDKKVWCIIVLLNFINTYICLFESVSNMCVLWIWWIFFVFISFLAGCVLTD